MAAHRAAESGHADFFTRLAGAINAPLSGYR
jgi:hypothetical protein